MEINMQEVYRHILRINIWGRKRRQDWAEG